MSVTCAHVDVIHHTLRPGSSMHARKHGDGHVDGHVRLASLRLMGFRVYVYVSSTSPYLFDIMPQDETTEASWART
jgi:hypothetical protein